MSKKYCPSNGSDGDWFESKFCMNCIHANPNPEESPQCEIWGNAVCSSGINDPEFPKEWTYDQDNKPTCTSWVKWDWGNDGDPNDPNNPLAPQPDNPNQLVMPFIIDEIKNNTVKEKQLTTNNYNPCQTKT